MLCRIVPAVSDTWCRQPAHCQSAAVSPVHSSLRSAARTHEAVRPTAGGEVFWQASSVANSRWNSRKVFGNAVAPCPYTTGGLLKQPDKHEIVNLSGAFHSYYLSSGSISILPHPAGHGPSTFDAILHGNGIKGNPAHLQLPHYFPLERFAIPNLYPSPRSFVVIPDNLFQDGTPSVLPPFYLRSTSDRQSEVERRKDGGRTEEPRRKVGERVWAGSAPEPHFAIWRVVACYCAKSNRGGGVSRRVAR